MEFAAQDIRIRDHAFRLAYANAFPSEAQPAYWASLWPSSLALAEHLLTTDPLNGKQVLEIGCGCGLAGIAAGRQGAEVTVTDLEPNALSLAADNWQRNDLAPLSLTPLDWLEPDIDTRFDLILGADILYHPPDFPDLVRSLNHLLEAGGSLIISEPGRPQARDFFSRMLQAGFRVDSAHYPVSLHGEEFEITVSEFQ